MSVSRTAAAVAVTALVTLTAVPAAFAKDGDVRVRGACTASSSAKLKLGHEDGRIDVEFEVDQNRNGVPWKVTIRRNGALVASTTAFTRAPSGSFDVRRVIANGAGTDRVTATAKRASGETCAANAGL